MLLASLLLAMVCAHPSFSHPHIVMLVLDDIGRTDTGVYSSSNIPMKNLKSLASDGVILENFYTFTVCSPTRSSLLTGIYGFRFGMQHVTTQLPGMTAGVPLDMKMLPELLTEKSDYETHMIGKWHTGYCTKGHMPLGKGFQSFVGYLQAQGGYYTHKVEVAKSLGVVGKVDGLDFWDNHRPMWEAVGNYSLDLYRRAFLKVIDGYVAGKPTEQERSAKPLFLYYAHQTAHIPLEHRQPESRCDHLAAHPGARRIYCDMLVELDDAIGEMQAIMRARSLWENTIVLVMSDNGGMVNYAHTDDDNPQFPASAGSNYPLRGSKTTMFDGGVRSTAFVSGGFVPTSARGTRYTGLAHVVDFSATILTLGGVLPLQREKLQVDGHDLTEALFNTKADVRSHVPINIVFGGKKYSAVRFGKYKLILNDFFNPSAQGWFDEFGDLKEAAPAEQKGKPELLFDLEIDPKERHDLSGQFPDMVKRGKDIIQSYVIGGRYMEPQDAYRIHLAAVPQLHGGVWGPFMSEDVWSKNFEIQKQKQAKKNLGQEETNGDVVAAVQMAL